MTDKDFEHFGAAIAGAVSWNQGSDYPWEGYAVLDAQFLEDLVRLAACAPAAKIKTFLDDL